MTQYLLRKGLTTLCRATESGLDALPEVFPVRKLTAIEKRLDSVRSARVEPPLRHDHVVPPGLRLVDWIADQDVVIVIERITPQLFAACHAQGVATVLLVLLDWFPGPGTERDAALTDCDACVVHSRQAHDVLRGEGLDRVHYIPPTIAWPVAEPRPLNEQRVFYFNVGVGGQHDRRNVPLVLETFHQLLPQHPEARLIIKLLPRARKYIADLGVLHPAMTCIERQLDPLAMEQLQRSVDVSLFPSRFEGIGYPLLESLHMAVPVIATDAPPMNEFIQHEVNGLLVRARASGRFGHQTVWDLDPDSFRHQLERLLGEGGRSLLQSLRTGATTGLSGRAELFRHAWQSLVDTLASPA